MSDNQLLCVLIQISDALVNLALRKAAEQANMTFDELLALPAGKSRRSRHDDTTVAILML
jgi:hypothetical protein